MMITVSPDHNWLEQISLAELIATLTIIASIIVFIRKALPGIRRIGYLLDDWFGEPARPGVPERAGIMERMARQDVALNNVQHSVVPLVDATVEGNHQQVLSRLDDIAAAVHQDGKRTRDVERMLRRHIRESQVWIAELDRRAAERDFEVPSWPNLPDQDEGTGDGSPKKGK